MEINEKYYKGYEGDPNMLFCRTENDVPVEKINIWDGYFDFIMSLVQPEEEGWTGLAYFYHLLLLNMLKRAMDTNGKVYIMYDV